MHTQADHSSTSLRELLAMDWRLNLAGLSGLAERLSDESEHSKPVLRRMPEAT